jgi:hypothetical protein
MKKVLFTFLIINFFGIALHNNANAQTTDTFKDLIKQYEKSIESADTVLAAKIWSKSADVSFINPRGTEFGWTGVKNIYKMFGDFFTARKLQDTDEKITIYENTAWLTFDWVFDAAFKGNNQKIQTRGRETQIWHMESDGWKLVHVHYSNMPVTGQGQGF